MAKVMSVLSVSQFTAGEMGRGSGVSGSPWGTLSQGLAVACPSRGAQDPSIALFGCTHSIVGQICELSELRLRPRLSSSQPFLLRHGTRRRLDRMTPIRAVHALHHTVPLLLAPPLVRLLLRAPTLR